MNQSTATKGIDTLQCNNNKGRKRLTLQTSLMRRMASPRFLAPQTKGILNVVLSI